MVTPAARREAAVHLRQDVLHIVPVEISPGHEYMIHRHGFLCATPQVQLGVAFQQRFKVIATGGTP